MCDKRESVQEKIKEKIIEIYEKLRSSFSKYEDRDLFQLAVLFREENFLLSKMEFKDDWKTYFYEFGLVFKLREITKQLIKKVKNESIKEKITQEFNNYDYKKYVKIDCDKEINDFFDTSDTFFSLMRCMIFAHPLASQEILNTNYTYIIENIKDSSEEEIFTKLFLKNKIVSTLPNHIKFTIQRYEKKEKNLFENAIYDNFSMIISNCFFLDYLKYLKKILKKILTNFKTKNDIEKKNQEMIHIALRSNKTIKEKIGILIKYYFNRFKGDIDAGFMPFCIRYLKYLQKNFNEKIAKWIIDECLKNFHQDIDFYWDTRKFDKYVQDDKDSSYWFDDVDLNEKINFQTNIDKAKHYYEYNGNFSNKRFVYYFMRFLLNGISEQEYNDSKNYGDLYSKILLKEIELSKENN